LRAQLDALRDLEHGGALDTFNCGYGLGSSVREALAVVEKVSGTKVRIEDGPRRAGDAAELVAEAGKIRKVTGWKSASDNLEAVRSSAYRRDRKFGHINVRGSHQAAS
jgi:UDP-glucose 4-epimerase